MDCREFRNRHLAFTDDALSEAELVAMQAHLAECACCARYDTVIRRGLLVLRNLPTVEPSPDFIDRLAVKLHQAQRADARAARYRGPGIGSFIAAAVSMVAAGFWAVTVFNSGAAPVRELSLAPVVAMRPATPPSPVISSDFVASASAGVPVWPAAMMAEQAPMRFADAEMQFATR